MIFPDDFTKLVEGTEQEAIAEMGKDGRITIYRALRLEGTISEIVARIKEETNVP